MSNEDISHAEHMSFLASGAYRIGPQQVVILIAGRPYSGAHSRRRIRAAMTRAKVETCFVNGFERNKAGLAWDVDLAP